ncbi:hypothetical protein ACFL5W_01470 [Thermodesulfobacteriota bacterium]
MSFPLDALLKQIGKNYEGLIAVDARNYLEVDLGYQAERLGYTGLRNRLKSVQAIVPLKHPLDGMKVRIDGRTFKNYRQFDFGLAVPGYVAQESSMPGKSYIPQDSMILNFN